MDADRVKKIMQEKRTEAERKDAAVKAAKEAELGKIVSSARKAAEDEFAAIVKAIESSEGCKVLWPFRRKYKNEWLVGEYGYRAWIAPIEFRMAYMERIRELINDKSVQVRDYGDNDYGGQGIAITW